MNIQAFLTPVAQVASGCARIMKQNPVSSLFLATATASAAVGLWREFTYTKKFQAELESQDKQTSKLMDAKTALVGLFAALPAYNNPTDKEIALWLADQQWDALSHAPNQLANDLLTAKNTIPQTVEQAKVEESIKGELRAVLTELGAMSLVKEEVIFGSKGLETKTPQFRCKLYKSILENVKKKKKGANVQGVPALNI